MKTQAQIEKEIKALEDFKYKYQSCLNIYTLGTLDGKAQILRWVISDEN